jgi:UDP-glucose 4-epimerase
MKILVTGGNGFIGSHLVKELCRRGYDTYILSLTRSPSKKNIVGDITDRRKMLNTIPYFDCVYHLAGVLGTSELIERGYEATAVNVLGTINILDGARKNKTKVVYITKPNVWLNTYSITKYAGESFVKMYHEEFGLPTISVRWYNVYGPNQSFHCQKAVPFFIRWALRNEPIQIWGNGRQTVDLIHVYDTVKATVMVAENDKFLGKVVDIGSGSEVTVNTLAELIVKETGSRSKIKHLNMRPGETQNTRLKADIKYLKLVGFKPKIKLLNGIRETIEWYKKEMN